MVSLSASAGVTSKVTTGTVCGLPSASCWICCPAASTLTFSKTVFVTVAPPPPPGEPVARTSTIVPGWTNPATPITSLTATETARMPSGITAGRPAPASRGASFDSSTGSFAYSGVITARPSTSSIRVNIPGSGWSPGQGISFTLRASSRAPRGSACAATTICSGATWRTTGRCRSCRYTRVLATRASTTAMASPTSNRLRFMTSLPPRGLAHPPGHRNRNRRRGGHGHPERQPNQPRIVNRELGMRAQPIYYKPAHQLPKIPHCLLHPAAAYGFQQRPPPGHENRNQNDLHQHLRPEPGSQRPHEFPVPRAQAPQQHHWKQNGQPQPGPCKSGKQPAPASQRQIGRQPQTQSRNCQPVPDPACFPVLPACQARQDNGPGAQQKRPQGFVHPAAAPASAIAIAFAIALLPSPSCSRGPQAFHPASEPRLHVGVNAAQRPTLLLVQLFPARLPAALLNTLLMAFASVVIPAIAPRATSTTNRAYSVRSCACSSFHKRRNICFMNRSSFQSDELARTNRAPASVFRAPELPIEPSPRGSLRAL